MKIFSKIISSIKQEASFYLFNKGIRYYDMGNYPKALNFFVDSCKYDNPEGFSMVAYMFEHGYGVDKNYLEAVRFYEKGCMHGSLVSCNNLGVLYEKGNGVEKNWEKSKKLYKKSCNKGYNLGCSNLRNLHDQIHN
jgi:TPR repeat protein